jgi:hypothetical protein
MESCSHQSCFFELDLLITAKKELFGAAPFDDSRSQIRTNPLLSVRFRDLPMTETTDDVVIYHPDGLQVGKDDGGTDEN